MRVVINNQYGGFNLSSAIEEYLKMNGLQKNTGYGVNLWNN